MSTQLPTTTTSSELSRLADIAAIDTTTNVDALIALAAKVALRLQTLRAPHIELTRQQFEEDNMEDWQSVILNDAIKRYIFEAIGPLLPGLVSMTARALAYRMERRRPAQAWVEIPRRIDRPGRHR